MQIPKVGHIPKLGIAVISSSILTGGITTRGLIIIWKCIGKPFLEFFMEFFFVPGATMNETEQTNLFVSQNKIFFPSSIFLPKRKFFKAGAIIQINLQEPEEDLSLDILVPDYSQQVLIINYNPLNIF